MTIDQDSDESAPIFAPATDDATSPDPPSPSIPRLSDAPTPFRDLICIGWRAANETWYAAALMFALYGPQAIGGAAIALLAMGEDFEKFQTNPATAPKWPLIAMGLFGIGNCFWMVIALFGMPWIDGAAAARIRERLVTPERRHMSFVDAGNRVYGRVLVLTIIKWLVVGACGVTNMAAWMFVSGDAMYQPNNTAVAMEAGRHPLVMTANLFIAFLGAAVAVAWLLCIAAVVVEDQGLIGAIQRAAGFVNERRAETLRLYLLMLAIAIPPFLVQEGTLLVGFGWPLVAATTVSVIFTVYMDLVMMAVVIATYVSRRRAGVMPTYQPLAT
jgi:hypothetical protein